MALGGGWVSDRIGVRHALSLAMGIMVVSRTLLVLSPELGSSLGVEVASPTTGFGALDGFLGWGAIHVRAFLLNPVTGLALVIMAIGQGILQPALYAGVKKYSDPRTATLGYAFLYSIMNLGIVAGEFVSPRIREWWALEIEHKNILEEPIAGVAGAFWLFIGVTLVVFLVNVFAFTKKVAERDEVYQKEETPDGPQTSLREKIANLPILHDPRFAFFIFILLPVRTLFAHQWLTLPQMTARVYPPEVGANWEHFNLINPAVIVIFVPLVAMYTQRRKVVDMMIMGTMVSALSSFMLMYHGDAMILGQRLDVVLLVLYIVIFSFGEAMWSSRFLEYVADIAPAQRIGIYMGVAGIPWFLAKWITGWYAGRMLSIFIPREGPQDPGTMWLIYGLIACVTPIGLVLARRWLLSAVHDGGVNPERS